MCDTSNLKRVVDLTEIVFEISQHSMGATRLNRVSDDMNLKHIFTKILRPCWFGLL